MDPFFPPLMVGTWAWGDRKYWDYGGPRLGPDQAVETFLEATDRGLDFFDTAEVYGDGESEKILGWLAGKSGRTLRVATKFGLLPGRPGARALRPALARSLTRLRRTSVELYQIHWPDRTMASLEALAEALADAHDAGLCARVGVSNFSADEMLRTHEALQRRGLALASNQVRYSLLDRSPEQNGVLDACRQIGATLLAYSPLAQGVLTGKYHDAPAPSGRRGGEPWFAPAQLAAARGLVDTLASVGVVHGRSPGQVAIRWLCQQPGVVPVVGMTSGEQAREAAEALSFRLDAGEIRRIEGVDLPPPG